MKIYDARTSFAGGELAPSLYARVDLAQYHIGCRTLLNFIVLPQGAAANRPGTSVLGKRRYKAVRLVPFVFSEEDSCVLAFSADETGGFVDRYDGTGYQERVGGSPYGAGHLSRLRWLQSADVLYLFHPDVPIHTLSREGGGWTFRAVELENGPFEDANTDPDLKISVTPWEPPDPPDPPDPNDPDPPDPPDPADMWIHELRANFDLSVIPVFVGLLLRVEAEVKAGSEELSVPRAGTDAFGGWVEVKYVFGPFTFRTSGKWQGTLEVERCRPDGWVGKDEADWVWETFKSYTSERDAEENFSFSGDVEEYANHYRFRYKGSKNALTVNFNWDGGLIHRVFRVREVTGANSALVDDVEKKRGPVPETDAWSVGSFGPHYGYPSMGIFHQERLVLANTRHSPQSIWMSQPASWHNFGASIPTKDDDSIMITLASKEVNEIRGLSSRGDLLILTAGGEWSAKAGQKTDVFTPSSIVVTPSGYRGSLDIAPLDVGDVTLFVQRQGTVIRSLGYSLEVDGYASPDISVLASHLFEDDPVSAWVYQQTPWSVVWCALRSGKMAALTLQREHQVTAWTRQDVGGGVADLCCIPGGMQDDLYLAVRREDGVQIERLNRRDARPETYRDAGEFPVRSALETLDLEQNAGGTLQGRHKHVPVITLRLLQTAALRAGIVNENNEAAPQMDGLIFPGALSPGPKWPPFSGDVRMQIPGGVGRTCRIRIENDEPGPVCVLGIFPEVVIDDN